MKNVTREAPDPLHPGEPWTPLAGPEAARPRPGAAPLRVLLIAPSMDILGGQAVQAALLLAGLRQEPGLEVVFQPVNPRLPGFLRALQRVKGLRTALTMALYYPQLLWRISQCRLVHLFTAGKTSYALWTVPAMLVSRLFGKRLILNYHDGRIEEHLAKWRIARPTMRLADRIVTPSDYVVKVLATHGLAASRIYNVLEAGRLRYRQRRRLRPVFLTNRGLEPEYNVPCVLRAFALVQKRYPEASLDIAHDGQCRPALEQLARDLGLRHTRFLGRVPHHQIPELYDSADIYLTGSNVDCMPGSVLECFASGMPVVATRAGGVPYLVTHEKTGLLVDLNDHEAMAQGAFRLLEDPDLVERLTLHARPQLEHYSWAKIGGQWLEVYRDLAGE